ncbi:adenylate kinase [Halosegnis rubeus]|jgi:adenylate kinase|uniref:Adenylate kinase n=1 Tax=Halosegnis rubeus TaxID=2212850 RepID=A0A5N5UL97_9EURY|nr:adenylate kinase [Halosegnis rubeus]KAB7515598.1 adenylate kinase [Halosegnis rubeus]KAB7517178.1 adenylate kinase [Halosegnis rubeus]KAB7519701.1 adenylate kinase [Halosegnis rubeus]
MSKPRVLLLGAPGAGKGTQSSRISDEFGVDHITTGDALRANKGMDISELGFEFDTPGGFMDAGELVPDEVVNEIVVTALGNADGFVLDGYPRNIEQAEFLDERTELDAVIRLAVSEEELVDRLTGRRVCPECGETYHVEFDQPEESGVCDECGADLTQREDDTEETVRERLRVFAENTEPVIDHYAGTDAYAEIDGEGTPDEVWEDVRGAIEQRA